jgi:hypothetical protein
MSVIDMREWLLTDLKRIKQKIYRGDKNRKLPKRALHIENILAVFASKDADNIGLSIRNRSNLWKVAHLFTHSNTYPYPT